MRYLFVVFLLAGCVTPQQRAERSIAMHAPYCEKLGFERNTDAWRQCIVNEETGRRQREAVDRSKQQTCSIFGGTLYCH